MTRQEAIEIARREAEKQDWPFEEPLKVTFEHRGLFFGRGEWCITTNTEFIGRNAVFNVDDETGEVTRTGYCRR